MAVSSSELDVISSMKDELLKKKKNIAIVFYFVLTAIGKSSVTHCKVSATQCWCSAVIRLILWLVLLSPHSNCVRTPIVLYTWRFHLLMPSILLRGVPRKAKFSRLATEIPFVRCLKNATIDSHVVHRDSSAPQVRTAWHFVKPHSVWSVKLFFLFFLLSLSPNTPWGLRVQALTVVWHERSQFLRDGV